MSRTSPSVERFRLVTQDEPPGVDRTGLANRASAPAVQALSRRVGSGPQRSGTGPGPPTYARAVARPIADQPLLARLGLAVLVSGLAGLLVAGLALPVVGALGLATKSAAENFMDLPTELGTPTLATRSRVVAADGSTLATFYAIDRAATTFDQVPETTRQAIVAIEDSRFYEHNGVDIKGTVRAAVTNVTSGRVAQGGSTITQQYVKNALIERAAGDKNAQLAAREESVDRKLQEARYALALERELSKDEILHRYLEIAYYGNGVYGIGTAANFYFQKPVTKLTLTDSAELAGMVQNPNRFNPMSQKVEVRRDVLARRNTVLGRMRDLGNITSAEHAVAVKAALPRVAPAKTPPNCDAAGVSAPFFCDYMLRELTTTDVGAALGATREERFERLFRGGLVITTSLDPRIQAATQAAVNDRLPADDPSGAVTASNVVEPGTGLIKAMAVNRAYGSKPGQTQVNYATGGSAGFQPGSTFKPFTLAAALQQGIPVSTRINSPATYESQVFRNGRVPYEVDNAGDSEAGNFDLRTATALSVNTYYIQLAERTGLEAPYSLAERLGIRQKVPGKPDEMLNRDSPAGVLGSFEVSPLAMAGAYAAFAAHGRFCPPRAIVSITSPNGPVAVPNNACSQVLEPGVADTVTDLLRGVISNGTASRNGQLGRPAAGKTGTTNDSKAAWFVGYTPQLATSVWVGKPAAKGAVTPMTRTVIGGRYYSQMYGGDLPTQIWADAMRGSLEGLPELPFERADPDVVDGAESTVPDVSGVSYDEAFRRLTEAGLSPTRGRIVSSQLPRGVVSYTYPRADAAAAPGTTTYIYTSGGG